MANRETFDDVFDEEADEIVISEKEWKKVETDLKKDGYREGLDSGQEVTLQTGFNKGYSQAVSIIQRFGQLRGKLSAYLSLRQKNQSTQDNSAMESLLNKISEFEKQLISRVQQHTPGNEMDCSKTIDGPIHSEGSVGGENRSSGCDCDSTCSKSNCCCVTGNCSSGLRETTPLNKQFYKELEEEASEKYKQFGIEAEKILPS